MEKLKPTLEVIDLFLKVSLAAIAFFLFGVEKDRLSLEAKRLGILDKQQASNLVVAEKIIALLFEEKNKCIAEDQAFLIDFLIDCNNEYNKIKINKREFYQASAARRNCSTGSVAQDQEVSASLHQGSVPVLNTEDIPRIQKALENKGVVVQPTDNTPEKPSGYVAVGAFSKIDKSFRNFFVPVNAKGDAGSKTTCLLFRRGLLRRYAQGQTVKSALDSLE